MDSSTLRCSGCLNIKSLLRILKCKHELCELCCKKYFQKTENVQPCIICPIDLELTIMTNDFNDVNELPKKLAVELLCDSCSQNQLLSNHWWCNNCNEAVCRYKVLSTTLKTRAFSSTQLCGSHDDYALLLTFDLYSEKFVCCLSFLLLVILILFCICSWCAMQNHRSHDCTAWTDGKVVQECLRIFDPFLKSSSKIAEADIDEFCSKLASELKTHLHGMNEIEHAANSMKHIFGNEFNSIPSADEYQPPIGTFIKKLQTMNSVMSSVGQEFAFDVIEVNSVCKSLSGKQLHIPTVKTVADLFYKNTNLNLEPKVKQESKPVLNVENNAGSIAEKNEEVLKEPFKSTAEVNCAGVIFVKI